MVAIMAMTTCTYAKHYSAYGPDSYQAIHGGGDKDVSYSEDKGLYLGLGYSFMRDSGEVTYSGTTYSGNIDGHAATFVLGYDFNQNIALEARYNTVIGDVSYDISGLSGDYDSDVSNMSIFIKPKYIIDKTTLYALLGYGQVEVDDRSDEDFQWGLGASFTIDRNINLFVDYTNLYNDNGNLYGVATKDNLHVFTFGLTYSLR